MCFFVFGTRERVCFVFCLFLRLFAYSFRLSEFYLFVLVYMGLVT